MQGAFHFPTPFPALSFGQWPLWMVWGNLFVLLICTSLIFSNIDIFSFCKQGEWNSSWNWVLEHLPCFDIFSDVIPQDIPWGQVVFLIAPCECNCPSAQVFTVSLRAKSHSVTAFLRGTLPLPTPFFFFTGVELIFSVVLVLGVQDLDSVVQRAESSFLGSSPYRLLVFSIVHCAIQ